MTTLRNCTPHDISVYVNEGILTIKPSGILPRVEQRKEEGLNLSFEGFSIPTMTTKTGGIVGLPDQQEDTYLIVSMFVLEEGKKAGRTDLLAPDTIRDSQGNITGCRGFLS